MSFKARLAANILVRGGIVSLPTDTIQGLSCLPFSDSLQRLIELKHRASNKGLILISNDISHFENFVENPQLLTKVKVGDKPTTYLLNAASNIPILLTGGMKTIAIRLTDNPLIADLCNSTNSALVSTSANVSGFPVAQTSLKLRVYFNDQLDFIISPNAQKNAPSHIVNLETGEEIR